MRPKAFILLFLFISFGNGNMDDKTISLQNAYFNTIAKNDIRLDAPKEGDWLFEHKEKGQTINDYKKANPIRPSVDRSVIYLMPVGEFTETQTKALNLTRDYIAIFFELKTVLLKPLPDKTIPRSDLRIRENNNVQLLAPYVLDTLLKNRTPKDGIALLAISARDLYPKVDWNYVFGLASYVDRVAVSSVFRLQGKKLDTTNFKTFVRRLLNISSHEIGHMMSLQHCIYAKCTMNGSNSLYETDLSPNRLCSECQRKLYWNLRYDNYKRLGKLVDFFKVNGLETDLNILNLDANAIVK